MTNDTFNALPGVTLTSGRTLRLHRLPFVGRELLAA